MRLEGRKHARTPERFLVQISSVHDLPLEWRAYGRGILKSGDEFLIQDTRRGERGDHELGELLLGSSER